MLQRVLCDRVYAFPQERSSWLLEKEAAIRDDVDLRELVEHLRFPTGKRFEQVLDLLVSPHPVPYFWHIFEVDSYIAMVFGQQIIALLNQWRRKMVEACCTLHGQDAEMIPADFIEHDHIEGSSGRPRGSLSRGFSCKEI
jgi:hypothetical protein